LFELHGLEIASEEEVQVITNHLVCDVPGLCSGIGSHCISFHVRRSREPQTV
jgi:hypothetical protein